MLNLDAIAVDPQKSNDGVWVNVFGAEMKIARFGSRKAEAARNAALVDFYNKLSERKDEKVTEDDEKLLQDLQTKVVAEHILLDWKGVHRGEKEIPYSTEAAFEILSDPRYEDLYQLIIRKSTEYENYREQQEEAIKKDTKK